MAETEFKCTPSRRSSGLGATLLLEDWLRATTQGADKLGGWEGGGRKEEEECFLPRLPSLLTLAPLSSQLGTLLTPLQTAHAPVTSTPQDVASRDLASGVGSCSFRDVGLGMVRVVTKAPESLWLGRVNGSGHTMGLGHCVLTGCMVP